MTLNPKALHKTTNLLNLIAEPPRVIPITEELMQLTVSLDNIDSVSDDLIENALDLQNKYHRAIDAINTSLKENGAVPVDFTKDS